MDRQEKEKRERRWVEEREQAEVERHRAEEHKREAEFVTELMQNWEEADRLWRFVKALEESAGQLELSDEENHDIQAVVDWSGEYADSLIRSLICQASSLSLSILNGRMPGVAAFQ